MATSLTANLILQKTKLDRLSNVRKLNVCGAQVSHIHVLRDAINAEVLSLSVNHIEDLSPLSFLVGLRELYLRKNRISDLMQVLHLSQLENLQVLGLSENPISSDPSYRPFTIAAIPSLSRLDDIDITPSERRAAESEFSEVLHWAPPDPIPMGQIGGGGGGAAVAAPASLNSSPNRDRGGGGGAGGDRYDPSYATNNGAQTARRPSSNNAGTTRGDEDYRAVPATARRPSAAASARDDMAAGGYGGGGGGGGGWDDVPVGGGRPSRPKQSAAAAARHKDPFGSADVMSPTTKALGGAAGGSSSSASSLPPPSGHAPQQRRSSSAAVNYPPPQPYRDEGQQRLPAGMMASPSSMAAQNGNSPTRGVVPPVAIPQPHRQHQYNADEISAPLRAIDPSSDVEGGIIRAIQMLIDQLSPSGAAEVQRYAASRQ